VTPALTALLVFAAVAVASPILSSLLRPIVRVPLVVFELVIGLVLGPAVLGWIQVNQFTAFLANIGLASLFFLAGNEIDFAAVRGRSLGFAGGAWLVSLAVGLGVGILLTHSVSSGVFVGIAVTTTALGAIMPLLRDAGELNSPFGRTILAVGAVGEFGPLIGISLFLSGHSPLTESLVLIGFVLLAAAAIFLASRAPLRPLHRLITATLHTSGQFAVRLVILILAALTFLSVALGLDMLLGAFVAGVLSRVVLAAAPEDARESIEGKLEAVGFGFLVPFFFINTGLTFSLGALTANPFLLALVPIFLVVFVVVRGVPTLMAVPRATPWRDRGAVILFASTGLPVIVAVTGIGVRSHELSPGLAAALVAAGMLSVLVLPAVGLALHRRTAAQLSQQQRALP
jgi:Kef-type K+ transport system membrane component KefB